MIRAQDGRVAHLAPTHSEHSLPDCRRHVARNVLEDMGKVRDSLDVMLLAIEALANPDEGDDPEMIARPARAAFVDALKHFSWIRSELEQAARADTSKGARR